MTIRAVPVLLALAAAGASAETVKVQWDKVERELSTTPTLQVVVNPPLLPGSPIHDRVFAELRALGADYVRFVPWLPYPRLGVAELEPPTKEKTSWDFTVIDPMTIDFLNATKGHPAVLNFSTIPQWMFVTPKPVTYPQDPRTGDLELHAGHRTPRPFGQGTRRLLRAPRELVRERRLHGRTRKAPRVGPPLQDRLLGGAQRARHRAQYDPGAVHRAL